MAGILVYGTSLTQSEFVGADHKIHHELEASDQVSVSASNWIELLKEAEALGVPVDMWPDYVTSIDLQPDEVIAKNKALRGRLEQLGVTSEGRQKRLGFVLGLIEKGYYIVFLREY